MRPTEYKPEFCEKVIEFFEQGCSKAEIAYFFRIDRDTIKEWVKKYPEFATAVKKGEEFSEAKWDIWGRENLANKEFNTRLYEINRMNRHGWSRKNDNKQQVNISHEDALKEVE